VRPNAAGKAFRASPAGFRGGMDASACRHFGEAKGGLQVVTFQELDERVPFARQLGAGGGPIVFMNTFHVAPEEVDGFMEAWRVDGEFMQRQPGYVSTQLHRGIAGSTTFVNVAVWDSVEAMRNAVSRPEFQSSLANYPPSSVASPHIFTKVAVPGICDA
jgi:heme-degrading monooxygenase HmoA